MLITGGLNPLTATGEVYDSITGVFTPVSNSMVNARGVHSATTLPNGNVIIARGYNLSGYLKTLELYNSTSNTFILLSALMSVACYVHTATYILRSC